MANRKIEKIFSRIHVLEGAGVRLNRLFGFQSDNVLDPFLLLDDFSSNNYVDYIKGFPWHPHRGIETITYILQGDVEHKDSLGNEGVINPGDVQWMTAGSGIIHQEMPQKTDGWLKGFQLWANLPKSHKMMVPRYRDVKAETIPTKNYGNGVSIKIIAGKIDDIEGPVKDIVIQPEYFDVSMPANTEWVHDIPTDITSFLYIFEGTAQCDLESARMIPDGNVVKFSSEGSINIQTKDKPARFLFVSGQPLKEPIAWRGPIVMNTQEELDQAFWEFRHNQFIHHKV